MPIRVIPATIFIYLNIFSILVVVSDNDSCRVGDEYYIDLYAKIFFGSAQFSVSPSSNLSNIFCASSGLLGS